MIPFFKRKKKGYKCILNSDANELIADGVATFPEESSVEITSEKGLPSLPLGSQIKMVIYGEDGAMKVYRGKVYYSNKDKMRVDEAYLCSTNEKRRTYRVNVNSDARLTAYRRNGTGLQKAWVEMVKLRDISSGGCLIEGRPGLVLKKGDPNQRLMLRLTLYNTVEEVEVTVKSQLNKKTDTTWYGLEFAELSQRIAQAVDMYVLRLQQDQIRRSRHKEPEDE